MKVAIGTHDKKTLNVDHFGQSRYFCVVEILLAKPYSIEYRKNPASDWHGTGKSGQILELLQDCEAIIVHRMGQGGLRKFPQADKQIFMTSLSELDEIINLFSQGEMQYFKKFNPVKGKFEECEV